jgi:hypothetical protein
MGVLGDRRSINVSGTTKKISTEDITFEMSVMEGICSRMTYDPVENIFMMD